MLLTSLLIACVAPALAGPATTQASAGFDMKQAVDYLASDQLEGRRIGTPGIALAGDYVADQFRQFGLRPLPGQSDYFQRFTMTTAVAPDPKTALSWNRQAYKIGDDFVVASFSAAADFDGPLVFVGYGITDPQHQYDDYARVDVKGKIVLAMRFEPHNAAGTSRFDRDGWSMDATLARKAKTAADHGAVALVLVNPPTFHVGDFLLSFSSSYRGPPADIPVLQVTQKVADSWLVAGGAKDLKTLQAQIDMAVKPASAQLSGVKLAGTVAIQRTTKEVRNVLAILPGTGPNASQYVFVGAHYDHLGHGGQGSLAPGSHAIFHGADDNASGTAAMLAMADHFAHAGPQPRTLIFAAWTAEEEGLIGSGYFVNHPLLPLSQIEADLNLDMVGRVRNNVIYIGGAGTAADFDALLKKADEASPLELKSFGRGGYGPSDHMSFALKKIPVLFLFSGLHADYHRPTDTSDKINFQGMQDVVSFAEKIVDGLDTLPRETYIAASDSAGGMAMHAGAGNGSGGASLGVVPDYSGDDSATKGVRISGTVPDSPAAAAGLKEGDIIVGFGADKVDTLYDLSDELAKGTPGQQVKIAVLRGKERVELHATLAARRAE